MFELIALRYEFHTLIIASNQSCEELDEIFTNTTMTVVAIEKLVHHTYYSINYRKLQKKRVMEYQIHSAISISRERNIINYYKKHLELSILIISNQKRAF